MTARETAERLVMDYLKQLDAEKGMIHPDMVRKSKMHAHYVVNKIIEELRMNFQGANNGVERHIYWKYVKDNINEVFE